MKKRCQNSAILIFMLCCICCSRFPGVKTCYRTLPIEDAVVGEWVNRWELGLLASLTIKADHSFAAKVGRGCELGTDSYSGTWRIERHSLILTPTHPFAKFDKDLAKLKVIDCGGVIVLVRSSDVGEAMLAGDNVGYWWFEKQPST